MLRYTMSCFACFTASCTEFVFFPEFSARLFLQECVLAGLLVDLSMLDRCMFKFMPGTLAAAALFLARVTAFFYSKAREREREI